MSEGKERSRGLLYDYTTNTGSLKDIIPNISLDLMFIEGMPLKNATGRIFNLFESLTKRVSGAGREDIQLVIHFYVYMHNSLVKLMNRDLVKDFRGMNELRSVGGDVPDSSRYMLNDVLKMPDSIVSLIRSYVGRDIFSEDLENAIRLDIVILKSTVHLIEVLMPRLMNAPQKYLTKYNYIMEWANRILSVYGGLGYVEPILNVPTSTQLRF